MQEYWELLRLFIGTETLSFPAYLNTYCRLEFENKQICDYVAQTVAGKVGKVVNYSQLIGTKEQMFVLYVPQYTLHKLSIGHMQSRLPKEYNSSKRYRSHDMA